LVDVAINQGGCFETSHATTHEEPIYEDVARDLGYDYVPALEALETA
jgi:alanine dehydrogenase